MTGPSATKHSTSETGGKSPLDRASTAGLSIGMSIFGLLWLVLMYDDPAVKADPVIYLILFGIVGMFMGLCLILPCYVYYKLRK